MPDDVMKDTTCSNLQPPKWLQTMNQIEANTSQRASLLTKTLAAVFVSSSSEAHSAYLYINVQGKSSFGQSLLNKKISNVAPQFYTAEGRAGSTEFLRQKFVT